jgi:hypothetical protein
MKKKKQKELLKNRTYRASDIEEKAIKQNYKNWKEEYEFGVDKGTSFSRWRVQKMLDL